MESSPPRFGHEAKSFKRLTLVKDRDAYRRDDYSMTLEQSFHDHRMIVPRSWNNQSSWARVLFSLYANGN